MSSKETHIHIDRLRDGEEEELACVLDPVFLDLKDDPDLSCTKPIDVSGATYIAGDFLIVELSCEVEFSIRCAVCSEMFPYIVTLDHVRFEKPLEEIRGKVFDFQDLLREEILVQIPHFALCGGYSCKNRKQVEKFLAKEKQEDVFRPFQDLLE